MLPADVRRRVDAIWDKIWASGVSNPLTAIEYFSTVLLLQRISESATVVGGFNNSVHPPRASEALDLIAAGEVEAVARLMLHVQERFGIGASPDVASPSMWRDLSTLKEVLRSVWELELTDRNHDILGDLFEYMLNHLSTAGHFGQFRTPRHLIQFIVEAVGPKPGEVVVDPACGTAGFLIAAHEYRQGTSKDKYIGNEVDATIARVAQTNVLLHQMPGAAILHEDSLQVKGRDADVILANPPFAGAVVADRVIDFDCGTLKTELLFVELMMRRLREGGRAGVVVPTGVLTSSARSAVWIRRELLEANRLSAVVELPGGVFRPYTGVKTGLLFWSREPAGKDVLMLRVEADGYSLDNKREPVHANDMPDALRLLVGESSDIPHVRVGHEEIRVNRYNLSPSRYIFNDLSAQFDLQSRNLAACLQKAYRATNAVTTQLKLVEGLLQ